MALNRSFRVASKNIYSRQFDDEVLIIDTLSGMYFSLRGVAVDVWSMIEQAQSFDTIVAALQSRYDAPSDVVAAAAKRAVESLASYQLIGEFQAEAPAPFIQAAVNGDRRPFAEPLIESFTDMHNLLLLDPIHETSEEGWPKAASASDPSAL
jgi:Coenzyme PQQ synthesis protein D (PqqD)